MRILLTPEQLREGVARMAGRLNADYHQQPLIFVGVLTGSLILMADLIRQLSMPLRIALVQARSYARTATRPGELSLGLDGLPDLVGQDVLLVDDIYDTGHTLEALVGRLIQRGPRSVRSAVLLRKTGRQEAVLVPDYVGFEIPDEFVVGYGMDYDDRFRNLPYVAVMEAADLAAEPGA